jgi:hypothetical protein
MDAVPDDANYYDAVIASQLADRDWLDHRPVADLPSNVIIVHSAGATASTPPAGASTIATSRSVS